MAETHSDSKPKVIVGGARKGLRLLNWKLLAVIVILAVGGLVGYRYMHRAKKDSGGRTIMIDGKAYHEDFINLKTQNATPSSSNAVYQQAIQQAEAKVKQQPTYDNFVTLANLYAYVGNKQQAIASYNNAKQYVPKDQYYQATIDGLNQNIAQVEAKK